jgi:plastocyanin
MTSLKFAVIAGLIAGTTVAFAAEHTVSQKGKVFSETSLKIKRGETLVFVNDDNVTHNVLSNSPGNQFNLGALGPGNSTPVTFDKAGEVLVVCAIHPTMKMTVTISD